MRRRSLALVTVSILGATLVPPPAPRAQEGTVIEQPVRDPRGRIAVIAPARSDAGEFDGTWIFITRDARYAMWIRTEDGRPQARVQFQSVSTPEVFETGWDGKASYYLAGSPATFEMKLDRADANTLAGSWTSSVAFPDSGRAEKGVFEGYRAGDGRALVFRFDSYVREVRRGDNVQRSELKPVWTFRKISKRLVLWDELPF